MTENLFLEIYIYYLVYIPLNIIYMNHSDLLVAFKERYLQVLNEIDPNLPIIVSIGKQSKGKSYFLGKLFNNNIPNKYNQLTDQGTIILSKKVFENFLLLDMKDLKECMVQLKETILILL